MLRLHFAEAAKVSRRYRIPVARRVGRMAFGRRRPLLEIPKDLGVLVIHGRDTAMHHASALEPNLAITLSEVPRKARYLVERTTRFLVETLRTKRGDVSMNSVAAKRHSWHMIDL